MTMKSLCRLVVILCLGVFLCLSPLFLQPVIATVGKLLLAALMFYLSFKCWEICLKSSRWLQRLSEMESEAVRLRDDVMFQATAARADLALIKQRLRQSQSGRPAISPVKLARQLSLIASLFFKKEKTIIQWAILGTNLAKSAIEIWERVRKS